MPQTLITAPSLVVNGAFVVLFCLILLANGRPESKNENPEGPFDCMKIMLRAAKTSMKAITLCSQQVKENTTSTKEYGDKLPCIMKCAMMRVKLLNDKAEIDDHSVDRMLKKYIPNTIMMDEVKSKILNACASFAAKFDPTDEYCRSYAEYVLCLQSAVEEYKDNSHFCIKKPKKNV